MDRERENGKMDNISSKVECIINFGDFPFWYIGNGNISKRIRIDSSHI